VPRRVARRPADQGEGPAPGAEGRQPLRVDRLGRHLSSPHGVVVGSPEPVDSPATSPAQYRSPPRRSRPCSRASGMRIAVHRGSNRYGAPICLSLRRTDSRVGAARWVTKWPEPRASVHAEPGVSPACAVDAAFVHLTSSSNTPGSREGSRQTRSSASCISSSVALISEPKITANPRQNASRAVAPQQKLLRVPEMTRLSFPMSAASVLARWHRSWTLPLAGGVLVAVVVISGIRAQAGTSTTTACRRSEPAVPVWLGRGSRAHANCRS
jgi:hypothetical protein